MENATATLMLKRGRDKPVRYKHPWIFSGAVSRIAGSPKPGALVAIVDHKDQFLAWAYFNPHSQIQARILSWDPDVSIDEAFWRERLKRSIAGREMLQLEPATDAYRLVYAEADGLPGFIVDKYGEHLVIQCLTLGIDRRKEMLVGLLVELIGPTGIFERSDVAVRRKEQLKPVTGSCFGTPPTENLVIQENGFQFGVDLARGHKTGYYLDQRQNRSDVCRPKFVAGKEILDVFSYIGGFSVYAAAAGAAAITHVDASVDALTQAEKNVALNAPGRKDDEYIAGDAFEVLRYFREIGRKFDMVILDPPKFAHSQRDVTRASRGYKDLNWLAMGLLKPGGLMATFSCSGRVSADLFQKIVFGAAVDAGRDVQILQRLAQAWDHPVLMTFPESAYLKGMLCRVW